MFRSRVMHSIFAVAAAVLFSLSTLACRVDLVVGGTYQPTKAGTGSGKDDGGSGAAPRPSPSPSASPDPWASLPGLGGLTVLAAEPGSTYAADGLFELRFIPSDAAGAAILSDKLGLAASASPEGINDPVALELLPPPRVVLPDASSLPMAVVIDLDSSGSMATTDPGRARVAAAKDLVDRLLAADSGTVVAVADFGMGAGGGLSAGRLLADFSSDAATLKAAIEQVGAGSGTPLYESVDELVSLLDSRMPASARQRMLFVLSDGAPSSTENRTALLGRLATARVAVHAVSLGGSGVAAPLGELARSSGGLAVVASDAASLGASITGLALARQYGYVAVDVRWPTGMVIPAAATVTLAVRSGTTRLVGTTLVMR